MILFCPEAHKDQEILFYWGTYNQQNFSGFAHFSHFLCQNRAKKSWVDV